MMVISMYKKSSELLKVEAQHAASGFKCMKIITVLTTHTHTQVCVVPFLLESFFTLLCYRCDSLMCEVLLDLQSVASTCLNPKCDFSPNEKNNSADWAIRIRLGWALWFEFTHGSDSFFQVITPELHLSFF